MLQSPNELMIKVESLKNTAQACELRGHIFTRMKETCVSPFSVTHMNDTSQQCVMCWALF